MDVSLRYSPHWCSENEPVSPPRWPRKSRSAHITNPLSVIPSERGIDSTNGLRRRGGRRSEALTWQQRANCRDWTMKAAQPVASRRPTVCRHLVKSPTAVRAYRFPGNRPERGDESAWGKHNPIRSQRDIIESGSVAVGHVGVEGPAAAILGPACRRCRPRQRPVPTSESALPKGTNRGPRDAPFCGPVRPALAWSALHPDAPGIPQKTGIHSAFRAWETTRST